jgi:hypothetical protein
VIGIQVEDGVHIEFKRGSNSVSTNGNFSRTQTEPIAAELATIDISTTSPTPVRYQFGLALP